MSSSRLAACLLLVTLLGASLARADDPEARPLYIIYDSSNSMWGELPDKSRKYEVARQVLAGFLAQDFAGRDLAFRAYGHRRPDDCRDSELIAPFGPADQVAAKLSAVQSMRPTGRTPIDHSLREALRDFGGRPGDIILISDGIESCDADPCALAREWAEKDVGIAIHVVGLGLDAKSKAAMQCIADASGTAYRDAQSAGELSAGLAAIKAAPAPAPGSSLTAIDFDGVFEDGERVQVHADIVDPDNASHAGISSDGRFVTKAGPHRLTVGVRTANGTLYRPVEIAIDAAENRVVTRDVVVPRPPTVQILFAMDDASHGGALVAALQSGKEVFRLRPGDVRYLEEGAYDFETKVGDQVLRASESFAAGDAKTVTFTLETRVLLQLKVTANRTGEPVWSNFDVYRDDEKIGRGHGSNGIWVAPGRYELRFDDPLTPYVMTGVEVGPDGLLHAPVMPAGIIEVRYVDANGAVLEKNGGFFIERIGADGRATGRRVLGVEARRGFLPGRYRIQSRLTTTAQEHVVELRDNERVEITMRGD